MAYNTNPIAAPTYNPIFRSPAQYIKKKVEILTEHFCITPTSEQMAHLRTLNTQCAIDNAILSIMDAYYNK